MGSFFVDLWNKGWSLYLELSFYLFIGLVAVTIVSFFLSKERVRQLLASKGSRKGSIKTSLKATLLGIPLPLCSCGVIPAGRYLKESKISNGGVSAFLMSTPTTGVDSIFVYYGLLGLPAVIIRVLASLVIGVIGGVFVEHFSPSKEEALPDHTESENLKMKARAKASFHYGFFEFLDEMKFRFVLGVLLTVLVLTIFGENKDFLSGIAGGGLFSYLLMIIVGLPLYICATASVPLALALVHQGMSMGTAFVMLSAGPVISLPAFMMLQKIFDRRTLAVYVFYLAVASLVLGYVVDYLYGTYGWAIPSAPTADQILSPWKLTASGIFTVFLLMAFYRHYKGIFFRSSTFNVGVDAPKIHCGSCVKKIEAGLEKAKLEGIVSLAEKKVYFKTEEMAQKGEILLQELGYR